MIDKETLRTARRTVERNGYTVLPPRERDERDLDRFRTRRAVEREEATGERPERPVRQPQAPAPAPRPRYRDVVEEEPTRRFKPLRTRDVDDFEDEVDIRPSRNTKVGRYVEEEPAERPVRRTRPAEDDFDNRPIRRTRPVYREFEDDYEERPVRRPVRREMNDDEKLGAAIRTAEENGFTIRKMSRLDQAKQVARDHGYNVQKLEDPTAATEDGNNRPARQVPPRASRPLVRKTTADVNDGVRVRTAPDKEISGNDAAPAQAAPAPAPAQEPANETPAEPPVAEPKKPTYADDFMNRAARFFGDED